MNIADIRAKLGIDDSLDTYLLRLEAVADAAEALLNDLDDAIAGADLEAWDAPYRIEAPLFRESADALRIALRQGAGCGRPATQEEERMTPTAISCLVGSTRASQILGISSRHLSRLAAEGKVPSLETALGRLFDPADLQQWADERGAAS